MNSRRLLALLFTATFALAARPTIHAESGVPRETPLFITAKKEDDRLDEKIFPIGWSKDGKFAWLARKVEEASDEGEWSLSVLDTSDNKVVETVPFTFQDKAGEGLGKFWARNGKAIQTTLAKYQVKPGGAVLDHLPVILGKRRGYVVAADLAVEEKAMDTGGAGVKSFKLNLRLAEKRSVLAEKSYDALLPYAVSLAGCFHSPDEKYAVLVVTALQRGYEGAPHFREVEMMAGFQLEEP